MPIRRKCMDNIQWHFKFLPRSLHFLTRRDAKHATLTKK